MRNATPQGFSDHAIGVPQAVGEHDAVVSGAVPVDIALRCAEWAGGVHRSADGQRVYGSGVVTNSTPTPSMRRWT
jgi:hypothetical protein